LGEYRRDLPLIIDPVLSYSSHLGGSNHENVGNIATDATGALYVFGSTLSANFPVTAGAPYENNQQRDCFVAKLNPAGTALEYATYVPYCVKNPQLPPPCGGGVNALGDVVVHGFRNVPVTAGALYEGGFLVGRLKRDGSAFVWVADLATTGPRLVTTIVGQMLANP
jgi:hypothetical protein